MSEHKNGIVEVVVADRNHNTRSSLHFEGVALSAGFGAGVRACGFRIESVDGDRDIEQCEGCGIALFAGRPDAGYMTDADGVYLCRECSAPRGAGA